MQTYTIIFISSTEAQCKPPTILLDIHFLGDNNIDCIVAHKKRSSQNFYNTSLAMAPEDLKPDTLDFIISFCQQ